MKLSSIFIILLAFLMLSNSVFGVIDVNTYTPSKDFTLTSSYDKVSICSCSTKYDTISLTNTGTWPAVFAISTNKIHAQVMTSENNFELAPGQSRNVYLYITSDCSTGSDEFKITVTSNLGMQKTIVKELQRDRCQNIELAIGNYSTDINPCQSKNFELSVKNTGSFSEEYNLESNYDNNIVYNAKSFTLEPNQIGKISATAKFDCNVYGSKDIIFTAHSLKNELSASVNAPLNILRNYDYDVTIGSDSNNTVNVDVCNRIQYNEIPVTITNKGSITNNYTAEVKGLPKYARLSKLDNNAFTLKPGESKKFYVVVDSTIYRTEYKTAEVKIEVTPELGDIVKNSKLLINFLPCYEHEVILYDYDNNKNAPLRTCESYTYSYDGEILNNGKYTETYALSLENAPSSVKLSKNSVTVESGKKGFFKVLITGPEENKDYDIKVKATIKNGINEYNEFWIKSYDLPTCHVVNVDKTNYQINYQTTQVNMPITNKGLVNGKYIVSWNGSNILALDDTLVNINKSETKYVTLKVNAANKNDSYYGGQLIIEDSSGVTYTQETIVKLKDKNIITKTFEYLAYGTVCRQFSLYELLAILLVILLIVIFLIVGPHYPYKFSNRFKAKIPILILLVVVFLMGLVFVLTFSGLPKTESQVYNLTNDASELRYEWLQDSKYVLDISKFFYDPDNATLKYNVSGIKNIKAIIEGKQVTFYPNSGWSGVEYAKITAYDPQGGKTSSPEFTLVVKNIPRKSFTQLYNVYCWYVNLAIFLIILVLIYIAAFIKQKRRGRK
jgi:hypothetical protein